jgi:hypothetical protein
MASDWIIKEIILIVVSLKIIYLEIDSENIFTIKKNLSEWNYMNFYIHYRLGLVCNVRVWKKSQPWSTLLLYGLHGKSSSN